MLALEPQECGTCRRVFDDPLRLELHVRVHAQAEERKAATPVEPDPLGEHKAHLDLRKLWLLPKGAKFQPARCVDCGYDWLQAVADELPLLDEKYPNSCPECGNRRLTVREPTRDEAEWIEKAGDGFLVRLISNTIQLRHQQRRRRFGRSSG